jgi:hypothetical protein
LREIANRIVRLARHNGEPDIASELSLLLGATMRNRLFLLSAAVLFAACADDQRTTAPAYPPGPSNRSIIGADGRASTELGTAPQAKPMDQVGFSKITIVGSVYVNVFAGQDAQATATCPAGTTAIGGGYGMTGYVTGESSPLITFASLNAQNGWTMKLSNHQAGAGTFTYYAQAFCAS